jgi:hypothetical protein
MPLSSSREGRKEGKKERKKEEAPTKQSKATAIQNQISLYKQPTLTTTTTTTTMPKNDAFRTRTGTLQATQIAVW